MPEQDSDGSVELEHDPEELTPQWSPARVDLLSGHRVFVADHNTREHYAWMRTFGGVTVKVPMGRIRYIVTLPTEINEDCGQRTKRLSDEDSIEAIREAVENGNEWPENPSRSEVGP